MRDTHTVAEAELHLRYVWELLIRERQRTFARFVEGVLAELTDETLELPDRLINAAREWDALMANPRGFSDWAPWRDDRTERQRLAREFEGHIKILIGLLSQADLPDV